MVIKSFSPRTTKKLAANFVKELARKNLKRPTLLALSGDLGAGKTTFVQGLASGLGVKGPLRSPTFLILKKYAVPGRYKNFKNFYHIDAYRIKKPSELVRLGFKKILTENNLVVVEWAEKIKNLLPKNAVWIKLKHGSREHEREISIKK